MNELSRQRAPFLLVAIVIIFVSCSPRITHQEYPLNQESAAFYRSGLPVPGAEKELDELVESVMMVFSNTHYKTYWFDREQKIDFSKITTNVLKQATSITYLTNSVSGTATLLAIQSRDALMLSCAHIFVKPDTIRSFYYNDTTARRIGLESLSIRIRQQNYIRELASQDDLEIILLDEERDLSLLRQRMKEQSPLHRKLVFGNPIGLSQDLKWGSQIYILGFPKGYKMITEAIVSMPNRGKSDFFMADGLFNPGLSGAPVLALKNEKPYFEMVGIATSSAATYEELLVPAPSQIIIQTEPYLADIYATRKKRINYGITRITTSEEVLQWLYKNKAAFEKWPLLEHLDIRGEE